VGTSDNNRKAKFYRATKRGRKQLAVDVAYWQRLSTVMGRVLALQEERDDACRVERGWNRVCALMKDGGWTAIWMLRLRLA
jgi:hypothetical protein